MSTVFPADYDTFVDPIRSVPGTPGSTLDNDHVGDHVLLNSAVAAVQVKLGKVGEVDPVSIEYRLAGAIAAADAAATDAISALANAALASSDLADHEADTGAHSISATVATAIAAHEAALDPHSIYSLETDLGTAAYLDAGTAVGDLVQVQTGGKLPALDGSALTSLPGGVSDHGALTGLADDDHTQYHTDARGDARYAPIAKGVTGGDSHNHDGGDGAQIAYASLSGLPTLGSAAAAATGDFEPSGAVSTHNAVATAHGISAWGATLVDDTSATVARATLGLGTAATTASTAYEASGAVSAHSGGTGVHTIDGVTGLQGALDAKAPTTSPTFTGTVSGITKSMVGLGSVDNTSDAGKPVSTAQQTALNLKANLASPTFTGSVGGITAAMVGAPAGSGNSTGTNTGNETTTSIGTMLNGATSKTTPVDADRLGLWNSVSGLFEYLSWANLKAGLSSTFVLLNGVTQNIAGKMGLGVAPTAVLHLQSGTAAANTAPLKFTAGTKLTTPEAGALEFDGASYAVTNSSAIRRTLATEEYTQATSGNMFTNGYGLLGDNTGMSSYTYVQTDIPPSIGVGAFLGTAVNAQRIGDQRIPIDSGRDYIFSLYAKSGDVGGANFNAANKQYFGVALYDIDDLLIDSAHGTRYPVGADDTTLAAALNPGDSTVTLTSTAGWENAADNNKRHFCWYGYVNSKGFTYPNYTYTRNTTKALAAYASVGAWSIGGISGNVITLTANWSGPPLTAGTVIRPVAHGAAYVYAMAANAVVPNAWTKYAATIGGLPAAGIGAIPKALNFRHGAATMSLVHLQNYDGGANNIRVGGISVSSATKGNLESNIGIGATYKTLMQSELPANGLVVEGNVGFGTTTPSARLHSIATTEQLRLGYDAINYFGATTNSAGVTTFNLVGTAPAANWTVSDATANAIYDVATFSKNSSGAGAAGLGARIVLAAKSSTTNNTRQASIASKSLVATHATRTNQITVNVSDYSASREGFCAEADGTQIKTSVNGVPAAARAAALTAEIPGDATRDELRLTELYNACKAFGIIN